MIETCHISVCAVRTSRQDIACEQQNGSFSRSVQTQKMELKDDWKKASFSTISITNDYKYMHAMFPSPHASNFASDLIRDVTHEVNLHANIYPFSVTTPCISLCDDIHGGICFSSLLSSTHAAKTISSNTSSIVIPLTWAHKTLSKWSCVDTWSLQRFHTIFSDHSKRSIKTQPYNLKPLVWINKYTEIFSTVFYSKLSKLYLTHLI